MNYRIIRAVVTALLLLSLAAPAAAYRTLGNEFRWHGHSGGTAYAYNIPVCLGKNMGGPVWNSQDGAVEETLSDAIALWNAEHRELFYTRTNTSCADLGDSIYLKFMWLDPVEGVNVVARTDLNSLRDGKAERQTINIEPENQSFCLTTYNWEVCNWTMSDETPANDSGNYHFLDLMTVAAHELGHASGLDHPYAWDPCQALMQEFNNECWPNGDWRRTLHSDDRAGFNALWPAN